MLTLPRTTQFRILFSSCIMLVMLVTVAGIGGSSPAKYMDMFLCCVCCVGSGLCVELITRSEESCRVCVRERESSNLSNVAAWARVGLSRHREINLSFLCLLIELVTLMKCMEC